MKYWRQNLILFLMFLLGAVTIYRLVIMALAQGQQKIIREGKGERGEIFFQGNIPLAVNQEFHFVYISPAQIKDPQKVSEGGEGRNFFSRKHSFSGEPRISLCLYFSCPNQRPSKGL